MKADFAYRPGRIPTLQFVGVLFFMVLFLFYGLAPLEMDIGSILGGNSGYYDLLVRSFGETALAFLLSFSALFFLLWKLPRVKSGWIKTGWTTFLLPCSLFFLFLAGHHLEIGTNVDWVKEKVFFVNIRRVVCNTPYDNDNSFTGHYRDAGCYRYYIRKGKVYPVFRGLGWGFNLIHITH